MHEFPRKTLVGVDVETCRTGRKMDSRSITKKELMHYLKDTKGLSRVSSNNASMRELALTRGLETSSPTDATIQSVIDNQEKVNEHNQASAALSACKLSKR